MFSYIKNKIKNNVRKKCLYIFHSTFHKKFRYVNLGNNNFYFRCRLDTNLAFYFNKIQV